MNRARSAFMALLFLAAAGCGGGGGGGGGGGSSPAPGSPPAFVADPVAEAALIGRWTIVSIADKSAGSTQWITSQDDPEGRAVLGESILEFAPGATGATWMGLHIGTVLRKDSIENWETWHASATDIEVPATTTAYGFDYGRWTYDLHDGGSGLTVTREFWQIIGSFFVYPFTRVIECSR